MTTLIRNARVITPGSEIPSASVKIVDNRIAAVTAGDPNWQADQVIDANGMMLCPGFIDVHCHGRNNFDFCDGSDEAVETIARGKLEEGVTTLLPTTLTVAP